MGSKVCQRVPKTMPHEEETKTQKLLTSVRFWKVIRVFGVDKIVKVGLCHQRLLLITNEYGRMNQ